MMNKIDLGFYKAVGLLGIFGLLIMSCQQDSGSENNPFPVRIVTLDPGHFHAALVQKSGYDAVDSMVYVYAPEGPDVELHLNRISQFNQRSENPTNWIQTTYTGDDFFEKMLEEKHGNVVVLAGNNKKKTEYIFDALNNEFNVLADKPMVINANGFELLKEAFEVAEQNNLLLYDIMTERFEISTILQKELSLIPDLFGTLENGSPDNPAITKESVHHFFKYVSGNPLIRPPWFFDVNQEGEGIVDVTTHLVDLIQWEAYPGQIIDYENEIDVYEAKRWPTTLSLEEFSSVTGLNAYPDYLEKDVVADNKLDVYCNGEINYQIKNTHAKVAVTWAYQAPPGAGDTHFSIMRGTKANLIIRQGEEQGFVPTLYIDLIEDNEQNRQAALSAFEAISKKYIGTSLIQTDTGWQVKIPDELREGHEAHFANVTKNYLDYLLNDNMPEWEIPNMLAKYYTTTKGLELALQSSASQPE